MIVQFDGSGFKNEFPSPWHGVARVHGEIENDLVQLAWVNLDDCRGITRHDHDFDVVAHEGLDQLDYVFQAYVQIDQLGLQARLPGEGQ